MNSLKQIAEVLDGSYEHVADAGLKYLHVCKNNGQFHAGDCVLFHNGDYVSVAGFASFVGRYAREEARDEVEITFAGKID